MKKAKRLLSLFLCLLMITTVFAVDASAIQYVGGDSTIGSASSGSSGGFAIWDGDLGNQFYIVGYRFSAVDAKGNTLKKSGINCVIDLIRFGESDLRKVMEHGILYIHRNGNTYNAQGSKL